jgi:beta-glucanase (GH16 family)
MNRTLRGISMLSLAMSFAPAGAGCGAAGSSETPSHDDAAVTGTGGAVTGAGGAGGPRGLGGASGVDAGAGVVDAGAGVPRDAGPPPTDGATTPAGWHLTWSDEFDGASGAAPDPTKWGYDVGGDGWGNNELEFYTSRRENSSLDGAGHLVISTLREVYMGRNYTSARLLTNGKFQQAYGRFETRLKIPSGKGLWPAFWALGADIAQVSWPTCGEIDIMENVGREPGINHGTLHGPGYSGGAGLSGMYTLPGGAALSADFHTYAVEWEQNVVRFYVDDHLYETRTPADVPGGNRWVYDHPFFLILNVAVGGPFPGPPDATTVLPQTMTVDYVRVYAR